METAERTQIILAAIAAAGPVEDGNVAAWNTKVATAAASITAMCDAKSRLAKVIDGVSNSKVFTGTVLGITREESSTRGLVKLKTRPSENHPDGIEDARTERTDTDMGIAMARKIREELLGHKIAVWIENQPLGSSGKTVRVIQHVEDLGVDESVEQQQPAA